MFRESAVERYTFSCHHCGHEWTRDYDVVHITLAGGHTREYYSCRGLPAAAPGAPSSVGCPACGAEWTYVSYITRPAAEAGAADPPSRPGGEANPAPAEMAREVAVAIETLVAAARDPYGFSHVGEIKDVVAALQNGLVNLPQLLHELGTVLERAGDPSTPHAGHIPDAARSLERATDNARRLTEPIKGELAHVRVSLATLESIPLHPAGPQSQNSPARPSSN